MRYNIRLFLAAIFAGICFTVSANFLHTQAESFFLAKALADNPPRIFIADISQALQKRDKILLPKNCPIKAESVLLLKINKDGKQVVMFEKNIDEQMPIASLTKLMTALVTSQFYKDEYTIRITERAVATDENIGFLQAGEKWRVDALEKMMLIESSNDAAVALAEPVSIAGFVDLMNLTAKELELNNTYFYNPTGLEQGGVEDTGVNYSTAEDLANLAKYLLQNSDILEITTLNEFQMYSLYGNFHHTLYNTNELISEMPEIIGSKTGYTEKAGGCLLTIIKKENGVIQLGIVLNSPERFKDMRKLFTCKSFLK